MQGRFRRNQGFPMPVLGTHTSPSIVHISVTLFPFSSVTRMTRASSSGSLRRMEHLRPYANASLGSIRTPWGCHHLPLLETSIVMQSIASRDHQKPDSDQSRVAASEVNLFRRPLRNPRWEIWSQPLDLDPMAPILLYSWIGTGKPQAAMCQTCWN
jgi:hypothetical protein